MRWCPRGGHVLPADESGLGLVEVLIAASVLLVALLALAQVLMNSMLSVVDSRSLQQATALANRALEEVRLLPFEALMLSTGHPAVPQEGIYDPDGPGPLAPEPVLVSDEGLVADGSYHGVFSDISVTTLVTGPVEESAAARRVTVHASWRRRSKQPGELRLSTVVAPLERGFAGPDFDVELAEADTEGSPGAPAVFVHKLRNRAFADRYSTQLQHVPGYTVNVYEDRNGTGVAEPDELLTELTPSGLVYTPQLLDTNGTTDIIVVYQPTSSANPSFEDVQVTFRSAYDPSAMRTVTHRHRVRGGLRLYLHDVNNTADHTRALPAFLPMDASPTTQTWLFNYSRNVHANPPGLQMNKGKPTHDVFWDYQFPSETTLGGPASLSLWTGWNGAVDPKQLKATPTSLHFQISIQQVSGTSVTALVSQAYSYTHAQPGWVPMQQTYALPPTHFAANDRLRLAVSCLNASATDCHLAYDTVPYLAQLSVGQP